MIVATSKEVVLVTTTQDEPGAPVPGTPGGAGDVVVAYDGSAGATSAVTWAATEARSRGARLRVLFAADVIGDVFATPDVFARDARSAAVELAQEGAAHVREVVGEDLEVLAEGHLTGAAAALVDASESAALLVVGHRGRTAVVGALLGSVAFSVTARARCPVVVVRGDEQRRPGPGRPVVVGADGSAGAMAAVDLAAAEAVRAGAALVVVAAWRPPDAMAGGAALGATHVAAMTARARTLGEHAGEAARSRARTAAPDLDVDVRVVHERPARALVAASVDAGLVVVGARGRGSIGGLFLGSVSHATIHGASCPVLVVRDATAG